MNTETIEPTQSYSQELQGRTQLPAIAVEKGDSLSEIISKFFSDHWGKNPHKLSEVREALQSYGLNYPKQSVAVALLRLAKASKIRRFKSDGGEFVYTATTTSVAGAPSQVLVLPDAPDVTELDSSPPTEAPTDFEPAPNI
jgi:hypothetical protein